MNRFGWILVKDKFWDAYETNRLIEEFPPEPVHYLSANSINFNNDKQYTAVNI